MHHKIHRLETPKELKAIGLKTRGISKASIKEPRRMRAGKKQVAAKSQSKCSTRDSSTFGPQQGWNGLGCNDEGFYGSIYSIDSDTDFSVYSEPLCELSDCCLDNSDIGYGLDNAR